jgi:tetratricopeptide (TPR) repeat protein
LAHAHLAKIHGLSGSATKAIAEYERAIALWESLIKAQPNDREYQASLAQTLNDFGAALLPLNGRLDEALTAFSRARSLVEPLVAKDPESAALRREWVSILMNIAPIQQRKGQFDEAAQSLEKVVEIESQLAVEDPQSLDPPIALASAYSALGGLFREQPDLVEAIKAYNQAIEIRDPLTQEHPEFSDQSQRLAADLGDLSGLQQNTGLPAPAIENLRRALRIYERLNQLHPDVVTYQGALGTTYNRLSDLQRQHGETAEALTLAHKARALFERLVAEHPKHTRFSLDLAKSHNTIGRLLTRKGDLAEAFRSFQRAIDILESQSNLDPESWYNLACDAALCVSLIGPKDQPKGAGGNTTNELSKGDKLRQQIYGDRAISSLRRATSGNFLDADSLQSNTDFDSIRHRREFQALVKEVEEKPVLTGK